MKFELATIHESTLSKLMVPMIELDPPLLATSQRTFYVPLTC